MEPADRDAPFVYCVPYFYLAGAPKAGSTDVYKRIAMHPEVVKPASKETRWFDRARFLGTIVTHLNCWTSSYLTFYACIYMSLNVATDIGNTPQPHASQQQTEKIL